MYSQLPCAHLTHAVNDSPHAKHGLGLTSWWQSKPLLGLRNFLDPEFMDSYPNVNHSFTHMYVGTIFLLTMHAQCTTHVAWLRWEGVPNSMSKEVTLLMIKLLWMYLHPKAHELCT